MSVCYGSLHSRRWAPAVLALALSWWLSSGPAEAQCAHGQCSVVSTCHTPARGVPASLWDGLEPTDTGVLPGDRDSSDYTQFNAWEENPYWDALDIEGRYLFTAAWQVFEIWDLLPNPAQPVRVGNVGFSTTNLEGGSDHTFDTFGDVDAPPGDPAVFALAGRDDVGVVIVSATDPTNPVIRYQNHERTARAIYSATIGAQSYAFAAEQGTTGTGLYAYNLSQAKQLGNRCTEKVPGGTNVCPGVFVGQLGTEAPVAVDGVGNYVVSSGGFSDRGFRIHNVSSPSNPQLVMDALANDSINAVAMWQDGANFYVAIVTTASQARIYDVSCIDGGFCAPGAPLWTASLASNLITFSESNSIPFLYFGTQNFCVAGNQGEWLFNVSNPAAPVDISPQGTQVINGESVSYWGWYYRVNGVHGFNHVAPRMGKFSGEYFYRAGKSILDVHRRTGAAPPVANFGVSPSEIYPGTPVNFTDLSTGAPNSWDWDFLPDGVPGTSSTQNPSGVTFPDAVPSAKSVTLEACNAAGCDNTTQFVTVLLPEPVVASVSVNPSPALVCQPVTFQAQGVTGQPPLSFSWRVLDPGATTVASGGGSATFVWNTDPSDTTGIQYTGEVTVTNGSGMDVATSAPLTLQGLPALPGAGTFQPTYPGAPLPSTSTTVTFSVTAAGATEWNWDFGEGAGYEGWTSDPVTGPAPTHTYAGEGTYEVQVMVRNCLEAERESLPVSIDVVDPVEVLSFAATGGVFCFGGGCVGDAGVPITFSQTISGSPDFYDYDWDGNGTFEETSPTLVTSHTYPANGVFTPVARVRRSLGFGELALSTTLTITNGADVTSPATPTNPGAQGSGASSVTVTWDDASADEDGFRVYRSDSGGPFVFAGETAAGATSFIDPGLTPGAAYRYVVTSFNDGGESPATSEVETTAGVSGGVFGDGFESGNTSAWSAVVGET